MEETKKWKIDGYISADIATYNAERRSEAGLTGPGQECGPQCMDYYEDCRGWVYRTWDGRFLIPDGEVSKETMQEVYEKQ